MSNKVGGLIALALAVAGVFLLVKATSGTPSGMHGPFKIGDVIQLDGNPEGATMRITAMDAFNYTALVLDGWAEGQTQIMDRATTDLNYHTV